MNERLLYFVKLFGVNLGSLFYKLERDHQTFLELFILVMSIFNTFLFFILLFGYRDIAGYLWYFVLSIIIGCFSSIPATFLIEFLVDNSGFFKELDLIKQSVERKEK